MAAVKYLSLFSGIGGFELGIQNAFARRAEDAGRLSATCIGYSEIDEPAIKTYKEHFEHENLGDITAINPGRLPNFDLVVGGFPCQSFSVAGKRGGFDDTRGTLFFDIARILKAKQPRLLVLENVKGLLSHDRGRTFDTIIRTLDELGYDIQWQVLNSKDFGVPQNRERVYVVGHLRGTPRPQVFPLGQNGSGDDPAAGGEVETSLCLSTRGGERYDPTSQTYIANTISTRHNPPSRTQRRHHENYIAVARRGRPEGSKLESRTDGVANTVRTATGGGSMRMVATETRIRRLTPRECERLQGFPDDWTIGSDTQRYKQCGNAVTVNVVAAVMERIYG